MIATQHKHKRAFAKLRSSTVIKRLGVVLLSLGFCALALITLGQKSFAHAKKAALAERSDDAKSTKLVLYPSSAIVEQTEVVPFSCEHGDSTACTWSLVSGIGAITTNGIYTAPNASGTAVVRAVSGSLSQTASISVSGTIPAATGDCASGYRKRGPGQRSDCHMLHKEFVGSANRRWQVHIPNNYVAGTSGLIVNIGGAGHGLDATNGNACGPPTNEVAGWASYLDTVPSPAPVLVCPEAAWRDNRTDERWNWLGRNRFDWVNGITPDDVDFIRQLILLTVRDLRLDPKKVYVTSDWIGDAYMTAMTIQASAANADLVAAIALNNESSFNNMDANFTVRRPKAPHYGETLPYPTQPLSAVMTPGPYTLGSQNYANMCGNNAPNASGWYHPLTVDDSIRYYDHVDATTSHMHLPKHASKSFCSGSYDGAGNGLPTDLMVSKNSGGKLGTEIYVYRFKGNGTGTPWCSLDWSGNDTLGCRSHSTNSRPALDLRNSTCDWTKPCNPFMDAGTGPLSASGYTPLDIFYKFFLAHPKP